MRILTILAAAALTAPMGGAAHAAAYPCGVRLVAAKTGQRFTCQYWASPYANRNVQGNITNGDISGLVKCTFGSSSPFPGSGSFAEAFTGWGMCTVVVDVWQTPTDGSVDAN